MKAVSLFREKSFEVLVAVAPLILVVCALQLLVGIAHLVQESPVS